MFRDSAIGQNQFSFVQVSNSMAEEQYNDVNSSAQLKYSSIGTINSDSDIHLHNFLQAPSQFSSAIITMESINTVSMRTIATAVDYAKIVSPYSLFNQVHQSTSWFQLRLNTSVPMR